MTNGIERPFETLYRNRKRWPFLRPLPTQRVQSEDGQITREVCDNCGLESAVGFTVPDDVWERVKGRFVSILCVACFAMRADACHLEWDKNIQFWPVSKVTIEKGPPVGGRTRKRSRGE